MGELRLGEVEVITHHEQSQSEEGQEAFLKGLVEFPVSSPQLGSDSLPCHLSGCGHLE